MTFEPAGDDEYELAATRPRPRRRIRGRYADRRRQVVLNLLDEHGPHSRRELIHELRRRSIRSRRLNRNLFNLTLAGRIVCYRDPEWPAQHLYRLATDADRAEARAVDAWLREHVLSIPTDAEPPF